MRDHLLVVNVGSTSIKSRLFTVDLQSSAVLTADYSASVGLVVEGRSLSGEHIDKHIGGIHDTSAALAVVLNQWRQIITQNELSLVAIGHRVVHGASWFDTVTLIDSQVLDRLQQLDCYAPLHNPFNRLGIMMAAEFFLNIPQYAIFDTAFHRSIPESAGRYAIPDGLSDQVDFYRYGFHGISCRHSLSAAAELLGSDPGMLNLIILHLGGGASATAIRAGLSIDTSMGFSPTEGLIMAGRCGDLDPMVVLTLQREGMTREQLDTLLNRNSGLRGICGDADMRSILEKARQGDAAAMLAVDMFCYRIKKYIGAYYAVLGDVSALVFTGGIGEHAPEIREKILTGLEKLGFSLDKQANRQQTGQDYDIGDATGRSRILVIHAEEERVCAQQILTFLDETSDYNRRG